MVHVEDKREFLGQASQKIRGFADEYNQKVPRPTKLQVAILVLLAVPAFFLRRYFIAFALMILVITVSLITNRFEIGRFGIEFATFASVTMAAVFPPEIAAALGFIYIVLQIFSGSTPGIYLTWVIPTYTIASYFIATLDPSNIAQIGIYVTVASQTLFATMTFIMSRSRLPKYLQYAAFNLTFNILLFQTFAEPLLHLMNS